MKRDDEIITIEDVHALVDAKNRDPMISPKELFRQVDQVRADDIRDLWKKIWIPLVICILSILGMLFFDENSEWCKLSIIIFLFSSLFFIWKVKKAIWWILIFDVVILYIVFTNTLSLKGLISILFSIIQ